MAALDQTTKEQVVLDGGMVSEASERKRPSVTLCSRCHELRHHSRIPTSIDEEKASSFDIYSKIRQDPDSLVINVIDVMDFPLSLLNLRKHIGSRPRIVHVFNRLDIIYRKPLVAQEAKSNLAAMLESYLETDERLDIRIISALKGWELEKLANSLKTRRRDTNIYFVGSANAGKSSLISTLGRRSRISGIQDPTVSHIPGTTLASIPIDIELFGEILGHGKGSVVDLPGVLKPGLANFIKPEALQQSLPHKHVKAVPISLRKNESLLLSDIIHIENITEDETVHVLLTPYTSLKSHCTTRPDHILGKSSTIRKEDTPPFETCLIHEFQAGRGGCNVADLVFKDVGFVSVALWKGRATIKVKTPGGDHCGVRSPALIDNSYKNI